MRKKVIIFLLCIAFTFAGCYNDPVNTASPTASADSATAAVTETPLVTETPVPADKKRIEVSLGAPLVSFENGIAGVSFFDLSFYKFIIPEIEVVTGEPAQSGNALKLKIDYEPACAVLSCQISTEAGDFSGMASAADYKYLRFWVNNSGDSDISIAAILVTAELKNGCLNPENALLMDQFGQPEDGFADDAADVDRNNGTGLTSFSIPAGFIGWAYYPLADQVAWWEGTTLGAEELSAVVQLSLDIRFSDAGAAEYLVLDDFSLANAEK